jgi:hypothetical protein
LNLIEFDQKLSELIEFVISTQTRFDSKIFRSGKFLSVTCDITPQNYCGYTNHTALKQEASDM